MIMNDTLSQDGNSPAPGAESDGGYDYESLLGEYEKAKTPEAKPRPASEPDPNVQQLVKEFKPIAAMAEKQLRTEAEKEERAVVDEAVKSVRGDNSGLENVSDTLIEAYLNLQYARDPSFKTAFDGRTQNPDAWKSVLGKARTNLSSEFEKLQSGKGDKDDVEAALATVKGTSQTEIEDAQQVRPKELFAMSDHEFAEFKRNLGT